MADFGALFRADDGSLLVTSDTPCYELFGTHAPYTRSGNVNMYVVPSNVFPLIVVNCGTSGKAGVLAVQSSAQGWTVSVLADSSCDILSFVPISGNVTTGYGLATYDAQGNLVFDSFRKILNARHINALTEGASFQSTAGVNSVAYTSGTVRPQKSVTTQTVSVASFAYTDVVYQCRYEVQYNCYQEQVYVCNYVAVVVPIFVCGIDAFGNFSCGFEDSIVYQNVCGFETQTVCRTETVQICEFITVLNIAEIYASVRTTSWTIDRSVASLAPTGQVIFEWLLHKSGYYKEVLSYETVGYSQALGGNNLPVGYIPPLSFFTTNEAFEGELSKDDTYPYTTNRVNTLPIECITAVRSDYA